ncbi:type IV pilus assembly protein PilX [Marinobacter pelagius]|uniref:Type IV pilus assembly protein PilX n=1 Tax=Marinobacter pelagius TaxID=379482 RepID=A0A366GP35_9GAMM|nr:PilX N-terminal domain-containing pilus assembly protein [Marinobacter pelagius]RBP29197.1 type IV pilus assembly protein PilX [Marinobacter pelagius]
MIVNRHGQKGAVLLISLIILLVLSILAVSGMQGSLMQERMAGAQSEGIAALEAAEEGIRFGERWVKNNALTLTSFDGTNGLYDIRVESERAPSPYDESTWESSKVMSADPVDGITPLFFVEYLGEGYSEDQLTEGVIGGYNHESGAADIHAFRLVARAEGPSGRARRMIEVYFTKQI